MATVPFVILFQGRSGSTWLTSMLNAHPQVVCRYEDFDTIGPDHTRRRLLNFQNEMLEDPTNQQAQLHLLRLFERQATASGFKFKFPSQYFGYPEIVMLLLKQRETVRILHLDRANIVKRLISLQHLKYLRGTTSLAGCNVVRRHEVRRFAVDIQEILDKAPFESLMREQLQCFVRQFPNHLTVEYDDLLGFPEESLQGVTDFLGVPRFEAIESRFRKATPDDLRDVLENYDELEASLAETPWTLNPLARQAA